MTACPVQELLTVLLENGLFKNIESKVDAVTVEINKVRTGSFLLFFFYSSSSLSSPLSSSILSSILFLLLVLLPFLLLFLRLFFLIEISMRGRNFLIYTFIINHTLYGVQF